MTQADEGSGHRDSAESIKQGRPVQRAAERLGREADRMEREGAELRQEIEQVRADWQRKRADSDVPGAIPREDDEGIPEQGDVATKGDEPEAREET